MSYEITNKEAFQELQSKLVETRVLLNQVSNKLQLIEREKRRNQFTLQEISGVPAETNTYKSIGKMFLSAPSEQIIEELQTSITKYEADIVTLTNQQKYLMNQSTTIQNSLKELIKEVNDK